MKARVFDIIYCIEQEDLEGNPGMSAREIASGLPSVLFLEVDGEEDLADAISDSTGWLVEGFEVDVIG